MEREDAACGPPDSRGILQSELGSFGIGMDEASGTEEGPAEIADHDDHGIAETGASENR